jgi:hypothetical protein
MGPLSVWQDLRRIVQGTGTLLRFLRSQETIEIALGVFEASSSAVVVGRPCRYLIRIANLSENIREVTLALEISSTPPENSPASPTASFAKHCSLPPRRAIEITWHYNWHASGVFMVDKVASPPDEICRGEIKTHQRYLVSATLCDRSGKQLDRLDIYQELKR